MGSLNYIKKKKKILQDDNLCSLIVTKYQSHFKNGQPFGLL